MPVTTTAIDATTDADAARMLHRAIIHTTTIIVIIAIVIDVHTLVILVLFNSLKVIIVIVIITEISHYRSIRACSYVRIE